MGFTHSLILTHPPTHPPTHPVVKVEEGNSGKVLSMGLLGLPQLKSVEPSRYNVAYIRLLSFSDKGDLKS